MNRSLSIILNKMFSKLFNAYGPQHWWPADDPFEVIIGAILTQNTNWGNVEKALAQLKRAKALTPKALHPMKASQLARLIKPAGYFNVKAKRIKNFINYLYEEFNGSLKKMSAVPLDPLRCQLLSVNGIGPETADSILLYAFSKPIFVVDAYTKRILNRHNLLKKQNDTAYQEIQDLFMDNLEKDVSLYNEYHALIVRCGKDFCRPKPLCEKCPLNSNSCFFHIRS